MNTKGLVWHKGSCHCRAVTFEVMAARNLEVYDCNCSICAMKRNTHFVVPSSQFRLISGQSQLTEYRFNTKTARHLFCSVCGVTSFYVPRSNPDGYGVTIHCLDKSQVESVKTVTFDGQNWEQQFAKSDIANKSKI
eukprot:Lithocolla_globosa_v1_NODE_7247_length_972_cov_6.827699.p1 type:complete len:136 gc:universal NODE_7247_length_972_cov_6.827699:758-351(-)